MGVCMGEEHLMRSGVMKRIWAISMAFSAAFCVTGCSTLDQIVGKDDWDKWTPTSTSLQISLTGSVTETIIDSLNQSYYDADELQDMIARSVKEYDSEHSPESVTVPGYSAENGQINLVMHYQTGSDYADYNQVDFFNGTILDAQMAEAAFPDHFYKVNGNTEEAVDSEEALSHKEYSVAVTDTDHVVQVPGRIHYISQNASLVNSHVAAPGAGDPETEQAKTRQGLVLPSNAVYYAEETEGAGAGSGEEEQMVIIYEPDPEPST